MATKQYTELVSKTIRQLRAAVFNKQKIYSDRKLQKKDLEFRLAKENGILVLLLGMQREVRRNKKHDFRERTEILLYRRKTKLGKRALWILFEYYIFINYNIFRKKCKSA